jgi:L-threonylcarbamoyladenylate synthase
LTPIVDKSASVEQAVAALQRGELVILPTETVYGLAAGAANAKAVARLYEAKGRPRFNPLIAHVATLKDAQRLARLDGPARRLAEAFWPGPLTLVTYIDDPCAVCDLARAGLDTVAIRVPAHPLARAVIEAFGGAVAAPSANRSGRPSPTTFQAAIEETGAACAAAMDGGPCRVGVESTVVSVLDGGVRLLRPGGVTRQAIEALVGPLQAAKADAHRSPGRMVLHYAPDAPVRLDVESAQPGEAYLTFAEAAEGQGVFNLSPAGDLEEAAANLFAYLRAADRTRPTAIAVAPIPNHGLGEAINDRLRRAAGFVG